MTEHTAILLSLGALGGAPIWVWFGIQIGRLRERDESSPTHQVAVPGE